jgi:hypothetical protein
MQVLRMLIITGLAMTAGTAIAIFLNGKPAQARGRLECSNTHCVVPTGTDCTFSPNESCNLNPLCVGNDPCPEG